MVSHHGPWDDRKLLMNKDLFQSTSGTKGISVCTLHVTLAEQTTN